MRIDTSCEADVQMMQQLYNLFFSWTEGGEVRNEDEDAIENLTEEEKYEKAEQEKEDKRKREEFERDQALIEFEEKGGFSQVLKDIFNPSDMAAMELDSVYQLKNICKDFYRKKQLMSSALIQTLDALSNERPTVLQMKRRHFNPDAAPSMRQSLEWMRINAERERIFRFKAIAKDTATMYYTILDRFTQELVNPKSQRAANIQETGSPARLSAKENENKAEEKNLASFTEEVKIAAAGSKRGHNFNQVMTSAYKENQLHNALRFITDYLRQVIENGSRFTSGHFFIMILQLSASEVKNNASQFIKILAEELSVPRDQYQRFIRGLKDEKLAEAFAKIESDIYDGTA